MKRADRTGSGRPRRLSEGEVEIVERPDRSSGRIGRAAGSVGRPRGG